MARTQLDADGAAIKRARRCDEGPNSRDLDRDAIAGENVAIRIGEQALPVGSAAFGKLPARAAFDLRDGGRHPVCRGAAHEQAGADGD